MLCVRKDRYRKPSGRVWHKLVADWHGGEPVQADGSFFVGDAAGRVGDHSSDDRDFAQSAGLSFYTQDDFFLRNKGPGLVTLKDDGDDDAKT